MKGNKGEWSEFYALLKLLAEAKVHVADSELRANSEAAFHIVQVIRGQGSTRRIYNIDRQGSVTVDGPSPSISVVRLDELRSGVRDVLVAIGVAKATTFDVPGIETLRQALQCDRLKSPSSEKDDISLVIHDGLSGNKTTLPLSLKSMLGGAPTLLNAGKTTNWRFKIEGLPHGVVKEINSIETKSKLRDRMTSIARHGGKLRYECMESPEFHRNLVTLDACLPELLANALIVFYAGGATRIADVSSRIAERGFRICGITMTSEMIRFKLGTLLHNIALGMNPGSLWDYQQKAHGGYLVVRTDGEIVCYHVYNLDDFKNYLLDNTKLETASTSRHEFGEILETATGLEILLNLQIRFISKH